jgi:DNA-binding response OmpR family regulator
MDVLRVLPEDTLRRLRVLPLRDEAGQLSVAIGDAGRAQVIDELALRTGRKIVAYVADEVRIAAVFDECLLWRRRGEREWRGPRAPSGTNFPALALATVAPPMEEDDAPEVPATIPGAPAGESMSHAFDALQSPEAFQPEMPSARSISPVTDRARSRVLIVDDEPVIRQILRQGLSQRGFELLETGSGQEALKLIKEREPDAVVLDAMLPDLHGFDVCKRLRESRRYHHVPVVMITGVYKGWRMAADMREVYGVHAYIEKPFDLRDVVRAVEDALAGRPYEQRSSVESYSPEGKRLYGEASQAFRTGDLDTAIAHMASAVAFDPMSANLRHQLGLLYAQRGHDFAAMQELEMAVDLDPARYQSLRNLAILFQRRGLRRKAIELWERALAQAPDDAARKEIRELVIQLLQA